MGAECAQNSKKLRQIDELMRFYAIGERVDFCATNANRTFPQNRAIGAFGYDKAESISSGILAASWSVSSMTVIAIESRYNLSIDLKTRNVNETCSLQCIQLDQRLFEFRIGEFSKFNCLAQ